MYYHIDIIAHVTAFDKPVSDELYSSIFTFPKDKAMLDLNLNNLFGRQRRYNCATSPPQSTRETCMHIYHWKTNNRILLVSTPIIVYMKVTYCELVRKQSGFPVCKTRSICILVACVKWMNPLLGKFDPLAFAQSDSLFAFLLLKWERIHLTQAVRTRGFGCGPQRSRRTPWCE